VRFASDIREFPVDSAGTSLAALRKSCDARVPQRAELSSNDITGLGRIAANAKNFSVEINDDPYESVAQWAQELGRRRLPASRAALAPTVAAPVRILAPLRTTHPTTWKGLSLAGLVAAYLQYYFLGVMLQIVTLPSLIVFVLTMY
jgi:hypothetical protein